MPVVPLKKSPEPLEPSIISMKMPSMRRGQRAAGPVYAKIEALEGEADECVFVPLPGDRTVKQHSNAMRSIASSVCRKHKGRKFAVRAVKAGAVEGVGIWRIA